MIKVKVTLVKIDLDLLNFNHRCCHKAVDLFLYFKVEILPNDEYVLFWKFDEETITFEVHGKTTGWVGFGLSPNGGMAGSDMVIGWIPSDGGEAVFSVLHRSIYSPSTPLITYRIFKSWFQNKCQISSILQIELVF